MAAAPPTCNICAATLTQTTHDRESGGCRECGSNLRLRSLIALLSTEIFGIALALPDFPILKDLRGLGMSDNPEIARRLAEKFDYTNTFYHQPPYFDATKLDEGDRGRYDFILSSEVMEHVPPPVERSFGSLCAMLKPNGVLVFTTPYEVNGKTVEHFPDLNDYTIATVGGKLVLINRTRDGETQIFDDLAFHSGDGSTLEMRTFSRESLEQALRGAGFDAVHFASEQHPEFGVDHSESWSLPIAARKGRIQVSVSELARQYANISAARDRAELRRIQLELRWWTRLGRRLGMI